MSKKKTKFGMVPVRDRQQKKPLAPARRGGMLEKLLRALVAGQQRTDERLDRLERREVARQERRRLLAGPPERQRSHTRAGMFTKALLLLAVAGVGYVVYANGALSGVGDRIMPRGETQSEARELTERVNILYDQSRLIEVEANNLAGPAADALTGRAGEAWTRLRQFGFSQERVEKHRRELREVADKRGVASQADIDIVNRVRGECGIAHQRLELARANLVLVKHELQKGR